MDDLQAVSKHISIVGSFTDQLNVPQTEFAHEEVVVKETSSIFRNDNGGETNNHRNNAENSVFNQARNKESVRSALW